MVDHTWTTRRTDGVTLVELVLHNPGAPTRVQVTNALEGPIRAPRRQGVPAAGWDATGYRGTVPEASRLGLGYATPAPPADPPVRVTCLGPPEGESETTPDDVVRDLGDPRPPRDAVPPR